LLFSPKEANDIWNVASSTLASTISVKQFSYVQSKSVFSLTHLSVLLSGDAWNCMISYLSKRIDADYNLHLQYVHEPIYQPRKQTCRLLSFSKISCREVNLIFYYSAYYLNTCITWCVLPSLTLFTLNSLLPSSY
jgi:hypothetical protein